MKASELDQLFDEGEGITPHLDLSTAERPGHKQRRVQMNFPEWMIQSLDSQARKMGVARHAVIKLWLAERLKQESLTKI